MNKTVTAVAAALLAASTAWAQTPNADGEVTKIDKAQAKITLKHGEITNLQMPPMTMIFGVKDKALLDRVKAGDKVRFKAVSEGGRIVITELKPAP
jgi:Cu/Ag efflux protein CusF